MALITCSECGKTISDKANFCPHCGNPLSQLQNTVDSGSSVSNVSNTDFDKYMILARRAKAEDNAENAAKYYDLALRQNPLSWEASFYQVYYTAMGCRIIEINNAASSVAQSIVSTLELVHNSVASNEIGAVLNSLISDCSHIALLLAISAISFASENIDAYGIISERNYRVQLLSTIHEKCISSLCKYFSDFPNIITIAAENHISFLERCKFCFDNDYLANQVSFLTSLITKTKPDYIAPQLIDQPPQLSANKSDSVFVESPKRGCYIATCVYGSYDCPQVWTLRRYRDSTLATTWYGRVFVHLYYTISPTIVKYFGKTRWFKQIWRKKLDRMVARLQIQGVADTPYQDKNW